MATGAETSPPAAARPGAGAAAESQVSTARLTEYGAQARGGFRDAWAILPRLASDPVGQLAPVAKELGAGRALWVGVACAVVFDLAVLIGVWLLMRGSLSLGFFSVSYASLLGLEGLGGAVKLLLIGLIPPVSLVAATTVARRAARQPGLAVGGDVFTAGVSLMPVALFMVLAGLVGPSVLELVAALLVVALCLNVLILFRGCTHVAGLSERASSLAVPVMLLLSAWLSTVLLRAVR